MLKVLVVGLKESINSIFPTKNNNDENFSFTIFPLSKDEIFNFEEKSISKENWDLIAVCIKEEYGIRDILLGPGTGALYKNLVDAAENFMSKIQRVQKVVLFLMSDYKEWTTDELKLKINSESDLKQY